ncbi:three-helix bundle dimerization domain-containing protein [Nocardia australiensis]|uniref:three-helix bundle dimerization domain-containing protein n=1 Tax=Nocardia australiensis TaxID=2887191 RepID=UPI001D1377D0|nr:substrate-binding domain-containing protein [Nocardia australiensis]
MGGVTVREEQAIRRLTDRLVDNYTDTYPVETVQTAVGTARRQFEGHPVREFVPILVERLARRELETRTTESDGSTAAGTDAMPTESVAAQGSSRGGARVSGLPGSVLTKKRVVPLTIGAAVLVAAIVVTVVVRQPDSPSAAVPVAQSLTTLHGVVGSEKMAFFNDPEVIDTLAHNGVKVEVDPAGSRQIATSIDLGTYDFAFPSSGPAAERIQRARNISAKYTPFSSPMAIATFQPIADLLTTAGIIHPGPVATFDMARYLELVRTDTQWDFLPGNTSYPVRKNIVVSTTDPRSSNSAAMYLAIASYVANDNTVVQGPAAEQSVLSTVSKLFVRQGYTENSSEGPFQEYLTAGMGPTPLVLIYEAQYIEAAAHGQIKPGMVLTYPSPTVLSKHTLVPLNSEGDRIGQLLSTDPQLQRLAAEHGFRTGASAPFAKVTTDNHVPVPAEVIDVIDTPTYDTLEHLLDAVTASYN